MFPMSRHVARHFKNHRVSKSEVTDVAIRPDSRFPRTPKYLLSKKAIGVLDCVLVHFKTLCHRRRAVSPCPVPFRFFTVLVRSS